MNVTYPDSLPKSGNDAAYQVLVAAHDNYLRQLHSLVRSDRPGTGIGDWLPYALFVHVLQLGRAVHLLVAAGYPDQAIPLTRSMLSATMNLLFIVTSGNPNGWALRYWLQMGAVEQRFLKRELARMRFDEATVRSLMTDAQRNVDGAIAHAESEGIRLPDKLRSPERGQPRGDTWTGLSDRALAERVGQLDAYETEYDYASLITHAQAVALKPIATALIDGSPVGTGPTFGPPLPAIGASYNSSSAALLGIVKHFGLTDRLPKVDSVTLAMRDAIDEWRDVSGIDQQIKSIFGERVSRP